MLATITTHSIPLGVFEESGPVETRIEYLLVSAIGLKMAACRTFVSVAQDIFNFWINHTSQDDLVCALAEKIRIIPKVVLQVDKDLLPLL